MCWVHIWYKYQCITILHWTALSPIKSLSVFRTNISLVLVRIFEPLLRHSNLSLCSFKLGHTSPLSHTCTASFHNHSNLHHPKWQSKYKNLIQNGNRSTKGNRNAKMATFRNIRTNHGKESKSKRLQNVSFNMKGALYVIRPKQGTFNLFHSVQCHCCAITDICDLMQFTPLFYFNSTFYIEESKLNKAASETVKKPATVTRGWFDLQHSWEEHTWAMRKYVASHGSSSRVSSQSDWHSLSAGRPHTAGMSALPEEGAPIACVVSACTLRLRTKPKNGFSGASRKILRTSLATHQTHNSACGLSLNSPSGYSISIRFIVLDTIHQSWNL